MTQTTDPWIGRQLGRYVLRERLGGGGGGAVYSAWDETLEREVAIKVFVPLPGASADMMERFQQEARLTARMNHPNIVPIYDVGEEAGVFYIAMRRLSGKTLGDRLTDRGPLPQTEAINTTLPLADALFYAHQRGIVHRDLKPANALFDDENRPMLVDFGIAKALDAGNERLTMTGTTIGTPPYMSPEQAAGEEVDHRSDIYSLGILLYQMVTGRPPFQGNYPTIMRAHLYDPPPPPRSLRPDIHPDLERIILKALAKRPQDRFNNVAEMSDALKAVLRGDATRINLPPAVGGTLSPPAPRVAPPPPPRPTVAAPIETGGYQQRGPAAAPVPRYTAPPIEEAPRFPIWTVTVVLLLLFCTAGAVVTGTRYLPTLTDAGSGVPPTAIVIGTSPTPTLGGIVVPSVLPTDTPPPAATGTVPPSETAVPNATATETPLPSATGVPTETPSPTATASATPTVSATASATASATVTLTPSPSPTPGCTVLPDGVFEGFFDSALMGCPSEPATKLNGTYQEFERGYMVFDPDSEAIFVFDERLSTWQAFENTWEEGDDDFACQEAADVGGPIRGFGLVWCENPTVRAALGDYVTGEIINPLALQPTANALLINIPARPARVALFRADSTFIER